MKLTTTLSKIRACSTCETGWKTLNKALGASFDVEQEINWLTILDSNGVVDMLCYFERKYPNDKRPHEDIQAVRDFNDRKIRIEALLEQRAAAAAAYAAADSYAAYAAARQKMRDKQADIIRMILAD